MKLNSFEAYKEWANAHPEWTGGQQISSPMKQGQNTLEEDNPRLVDDSSVESSSTGWPKYDVFLSFRGPDTRRSITSELYYQLQNAGIQTFMDNQDLEVGDSFSPELLKAIENSSFAIIVLSENYASSPWCLLELTKICEFMKDNKRILPLFYKVDPSDVRYQKRSFEDAFTKHTNSGRHESKTCQQWKDALYKVASFTGWTTKDFKTDRKLVEHIVEDVCRKVEHTEINRGDFQELHARKDAMDKIMGALENDEVNAVGVYGMGGIGKTTMVRHVADKARRKGTFHHVIMVDISHSPDLKKVQGILADLLAIQLKDKTETGTANRLSKAIMRKNKMLIILDDIWEAIDLSSIGIPSYKELQNRNSKILFTTRSLDVCKSMESQKDIPLNVLSEQDSWKFFVTITKLSFEISSPFYDVARNVARQCAGLPIALEAVAKALREKEMNEWNEAARRLKASQPANHDDVRVFNCVKFSYDCLRSEDAKSCFLLCCLFPQEYDIQIEDLLMYGFGKGLFQTGQICNTLKDARYIVRSEVRYLKSSGLLLRGKHDGQVRMHDVIRQMAILISFSEDGQRALVKAGCNLQNWPKINPQAGYCAISLMMNKIPKLPEELVCPKLQILLLQHNPAVNEIPNSFLQSLNELRVLDISKTNISLQPAISFCDLNHLRTLYLDSCEKIVDISILGRLVKLEILSLRECCPVEVPEAIGHLTNLRMLDITESKIVKFASNVISRLRELEELYLQCNFMDWGSKVEELAGLPYLTTLKFGISDAKFLPGKVEVNPNWENFDICIFEVRESTWKPHFSHDDSRSLTLSTTIDTLPDWFIKVVTEKTEKLQYKNCRDLKNILVEYDNGRLRELKHLVVHGCHANLKELMNTETRNRDEPVFEKLEELHLCEVDINKLYVGELPPGSLRNLTLLYVRRCHNLVNALLHSTLLDILQHLEKLFCAHMDGLEYVFGSGKVIYKKLEQMTLCHLPKLINIWNGPVQCAIFQNLKILAVSGCRKLKSLFTSDVAQCILQLEDLWVYSCFSLDIVVEVSEEIENMNVEFPKLKNLVLADLPRLTRLYSNSSGSATSLGIKFPSLERFYMWRCPQFPPLVSDLPPLASDIYIETKDEPDDIQHYKFLKERLWGNIKIVSTISEDIHVPFEDVSSAGDFEVFEAISEDIHVPFKDVSSAGDFEVFEATRQTMDTIMKALKDNTVTAVGVYGMGGVGKTSMLRHVAAQACKNGTFNHWIMAALSQSLDFSKIQDTLAVLLGFELKEKTEDGRAATLHKEIMRREKLLIILDNVWEITKLSSIGIPKYKELQKCKSKVVLTTRRLHVCDSMNCQEKIPLNVLSEKDSWTLFLRNAGVAKKKILESTTFKDVASRVAGECRGLPIALVRVARALEHKDLVEWQEAARRLEWSHAIVDEEGYAFRCIKLSLDYLKDEDSKSCFLLCCLFPEGHDIPIETLFRYAIGKGLFQDADTIEEARERAESVVVYLKNCRLLLDSEKDGCVRMHDVIRDTAMTIAKYEDGHGFLVKAGCGLNYWSRRLNEGYSAISLMKNKIRKLPEELVGPKLQILLLQENADLTEIPENFIQSANELRVLDLGLTSVLALPQSLSLLSNLQALYLDDCKSMIEISILGKLKKLDILSMRRCYSIKKFASGIRNLTNLRMLDLTESCFETVPSQVISRLYRLEELYMRCYFGEWGSKFENASFDELIGLSSLNTLQVAVCGAECLPQNIEFNPNWDRFYIIIQRHGTIRVPTSGNWGIYDDGFPNRCSRTLTMDETMNDLPDWFSSVVTERTEDLWYRGRHGLTNLLEEHDRGRLHGLKYLRIGSSEYDKAKVLFNTITWTRVSNEPVFENLKELVISGNLLVELCVGELPPGSLRNLKRLMVDDCFSLVKPLLSSKLLHRLHSLKNLACVALSGMKYVFGFEGHEPQHLVLAKLRMISLRDMDGLINIWDGPAPSGIFQSLKIFSLVYCPKLEYLFTSDVALCLLQLEELRVERCDSLDRIIEASEKTESKKIVLQQLKNLVLKLLPKLTRLSSTSSSTIDIEIECPSLEHLHVSGCPQFSISTSDFNSSNQVQLNDYRHMGTLWIDSKARRSHFPKHMSPGRWERTQTELKAMLAHRSNRERI